MMIPARPKVMIVINTAWNIFNFRAGLICALIDAGYDVVAVAPPDAFVSRLEALGCRFVPLPMTGHGKSLFGELALLWRFWRLLRVEQPAAYLGYTIKPNTYGSSLAALLGVKVINNVSGLGTGFLRGGLLALLVQGFYKLGLFGSKRVFFQNQDDLDLFVGRRLVRAGQTALLPGSGVNLTRFSPDFQPEASQTEPAKNEPVSARPKTTIQFLLMARLLQEKGVVEFVDAARIVKAKFSNTCFQLLGFLDAANPRAITPAMLQSWVDEGVIDYLGNTDDVRPFVHAADCVVLPSYREGTSRALLEAAAMAKPLIVSDVPGCREVVNANVSGLLCHPRSATSLAEQMILFLEMPQLAKTRMGMAGRHKMEEEYDEHLVIAAYLKVLQEQGLTTLQNETTRT